MSHHVCVPAFGLKPFARMSRPDVLKVFLGNLHWHGVDKPQIYRALQDFNLWPDDLIVPAGKGIAFVIFHDPHMAAWCAANVDGQQHPLLSAGTVTVHMCIIMEVFVVVFRVCLAVMSLYLLRL